MSSHNHEEDDFDDLDELLDDFQDELLSKPPVKKAEKAAAPLEQAESTPQAATTSTEEAKPTASPGESKADAFDMSSLDLPELDDEMAKKLQMGVDMLLGDMDENPDAMKSFEALMASMASATGAEPLAQNGPSTSSTTQKKTTSKPADFHETIARTMDRLKESNQELNQNMGSGEDDFLAKMLKELENTSGTGEGMDMSSLIEDMLSELSSKDILYEPIKEMHDKYPAWLEKNSPNLSAEELERYQGQKKIVDEIVAKFDDPKYSDSDEASRKYITERMELMQKSGAPPTELMGDLASGAIPGMDLGSDGLPKLPDDLEGCNIQ
ncbi:peroxisomal membrane protein import receptor Pex19p [Trichomonascus vanleenenianus]|uniref:Pex19p n=1 Tax=Trichomonascus vanleenenianus TaxID=2268995 RepID=UPI003EC96C41